jgi:hypothetical protein
MPASYKGKKREAILYDYAKRWNGIFHGSMEKLVREKLRGVKP